MYSSLDRVDAAIRGKGGQLQYMQTDHRSAKEIEAEPELSVLFALTRILNPKRMPHKGRQAPAVVYVAMQPPPEFLREAIRASGGHLMIGLDGQIEAGLGEGPSLEKVIQDGFSGLALAVAREFHVSMDLSGLGAVEAALVRKAKTQEEDEIAYWSAVFKLGSFAGELIRGKKGGNWGIVETGSLPFALSTKYQEKDAIVNPLGKAIKRLAHGEEESLVSFVRVFSS
jgi:hypothetical protein